MKKSVTPASIGALVRDARTAAGISQSELGVRIGASRFWVAQFEKGKPSAELGLALKALQALGLMLRVEPRATTHDVARGKTARKRAPGASSLPYVDLAKIIADASVPRHAKSATEWPANVAARRVSRGS